MRRRAPDENVEPFRYKFHLGEAKPIADELAEWCAEHEGKIEEPDLPDGVVDRAADIWEPLIAIADIAGGTWPEQARAAAVFFTKANAEDEAMTSGVELLPISGMRLATGRACSRRTFSRHYATVKSRLGLICAAGLSTPGA
jgi:hypothetical protein